MEQEIWKDIVGYEGVYKVSNLGKLWRLKDNKQDYKNTQGRYQSVVLTKNKQATQFPLHRLVALMFIPNPDNKPFVNHKNGIKNDNRAINLEWCTQSENMKHAWSTGLYSNEKSDKQIENIKIDSDLLTQIKERKKATGITITAFVEQAIKEKLTKK